MTGKREHTAQPHRTVSRVLRILETAVAAGEDGVTLTRLATGLDSAKSSVHGFVQGLVSEGYLIELNSRYHLGPALGALMIGQTPSLGQYAVPLMRELREELNETVTLAIQVGESVVYTDSVQSSNVICYSAPLRTRRPIWPTSAGKVFLTAYADPVPVLTRALGEAAGEEPEMERRLDELASVARDGMAFNRGETVRDVSAVAVGIRPSGHLVGAICVAGPRDRLAHRLEDIGRRVQSRLRQYERTTQLTTGLAVSDVRKDGS